MGTLTQKSKRALVKKGSVVGPVGKVFKSGNSAALRLPASLRAKVGKSYTLVATPSGFVATDPADLAKRRRSLAALYGSAPDFPLREV
jgi:antitoxin VapB